MTDITKSTAKDLVLSHELVEQISSQMLKLKKQNLGYQERIKSLGLQLQSSLSSNKDLEDLLSKNILQNSSENSHPKLIRYRVAEIRNSGPFSTDKENLVPNPEQNQLHEEGQKKSGSQVENPDATSSGDYKKEIGRLLKVLDHRDDEISTLSKSNSQRESEVARLKKLLEEKESEMEKLKEKQKKTPSYEDEENLPRFGTPNGHSDDADTQRALKIQVEELEKCVRERDEELGKLAAHIKEQNTLLETSTSELKSQKSTSDKMAGELKAERKRFQDVCLKLEFQESKMRQLEIELAESKEKLNDQSNLLGSGFNNPVELKNFFESNRSDVIAQDRIKDLEQTVHRLEGVIANLNHRLKNQQGHLTEDPEKGLETIDILNSKLATERTLKEELEGKLRQLEAKIEEVIQPEKTSESPSHISSLEQEIDQLKGEIQELEIQLGEKITQIEDMEQEIKILRYKGQQEEMLSAEISDKLSIALERTKTLAEQELMWHEERDQILGELKKSSEKLVELEKEVETLKARNSSMSDELKTLKLEAIQGEQISSVVVQKDEEIHSLNALLKAKNSEIESHRSKVGQMLSKLNTEKAELGQLNDELKDEALLLRSENEDMKNQLKITLAKKDELRDLLKEKLKDASKFKQEVLELEQEFDSRLANKSKEFKEFYLSTRSKLLKHLNSVAGVLKSLGSQIKQAKTEVLDLAQQRTKAQTIEDSGTGIKSIFHQLKSKLLALELQNQQVVTDPESQSGQIASLTEIVLEQKDLIRKLKAKIEKDQAAGYGSDLSVTSGEMINLDPEELNLDLQDKRRERDRLTHENFGLQSDVEGLEAEKERILQETEEHESHLDELKSKNLL